MENDNDLYLSNIIYNTEFWENDDITINDDLSYIVLYLIKIMIRVDKELCEIISLEQDYFI